MTEFVALKKDLQHRMDMSIESLKRDFSGLRTGRASTALLDTITVESYGQEMPLNQVGTVSVPEPRMISVQVWDKSQVKAVEKAIMDSNLGLNPMSDGQQVRIPIPPLSEERRIELAKVAGRYTEQTKIAVRNVRRDGMEKLKTMQKDGVISEDVLRKYNDEVQSMTDKTIKLLDEAMSEKEKEILTV
ncbi:MAG: ribosome recycling factor [Alphaproteobacteria bacterium]|nr:ribosome recycling factor [Alphaproteobacteria bacterium]